jgi:hypothetical protein
MNKLNMEILVHILDQDGKRTKPSLNRIVIPLQVDEVTPKELLFLTPRIEGAICAHIIEDEFLQRLVRAKDRVENQAAGNDSVYDKLKELVYMPILDRIEIQEIRRSDRYDDPISHQ